MNDYKKETPWYKWRFSLAGVYLISFFIFIAYICFKDSGSGRFEKISGISFFVLLALLFAYFEWKFRKPVHFRIRDEKER